MLKLLREWFIKEKIQQVIVDNVNAPVDSLLQYDDDYVDGDMGMKGRIDASQSAGD